LIFNKNMSFSKLIKSIEKSRDSLARHYKPTCLFALALLKDKEEVLRND